MVLRPFIKGAFVLAGLVLFFLLLAKREPQETNSKLNTVGNGMLTELATQEKTPNKVLRRSLAKADSAAVNPFSDAQGRADLRHYLEDIESYSDRNRIQELFQTSRFADETVFRYAALSFSQGYSLQGFEEQVQAKVLALHILALSSFFTLNDCLEILENLCTQYQVTQVAELRNALQWDVLGLAKVCAQKDPEALSSFIVRIEDPFLQAQLNIARLSQERFRTL